MRKTKAETAGLAAPIGDTAASAYHLSGTLDWSSLAARIKNQVIIMPATVFTPKSDNSGDGSRDDEGSP